MRIEILQSLWCHLCLYGCQQLPGEVWSFVFYPVSGLVGTRLSSSQLPNNFSRFVPFKALPCFFPEYELFIFINALLFNLHTRFHTSLWSHTLWPVMSELKIRLGVLVQSSCQLGPTFNGCTLHCLWRWCAHKPISLISLIIHLLWLHVTTYRFSLQYEFSPRLHAPPSASGRC